MKSGKGYETNKQNKTKNRQEREKWFVKKAAKENQKFAFKRRHF